MLGNRYTRVWPKRPPAPLGGAAALVRLEERGMVTVVTNGSTPAMPLDPETIQGRVSWDCGGSD